MARKEVSPPHQRRLKQSEVRFVLVKDGRKIVHQGYPAFSNGHYVHLNRDGSPLLISKEEFLEKAKRERLVEGKWVDYALAGKKTGSILLQLKETLAASGLEISQDLGGIPFGRSVMRDTWQGIRVPVVPSPRGEEAWKETASALKKLKAAQQNFVGSKASVVQRALDELLEVLEVGLETLEIARKAGFKFDGKRWTL